MWFIWIYVTVMDDDRPWRWKKGTGNTRVIVSVQYIICTSTEVTQGTEYMQQEDKISMYNKTKL